jgi:release factor glutamine methyltransferase
VTRPARGLVAGAGIPEHEAIRLLEVASALSRSEILLDAPVDEDAAVSFEDLCVRRRAGEPLQYLEGSVPFGPVVLAVDDRVLIPRPETEELLELVLAAVESPSVIVDLCTGSGNLACALAASFPAARVHATDLSSDACAVAAANAARNGVRVDVRHGDLFRPLPADLRGTVDVVVANPPYLAEAEVAHLPPDVLREPRSALVAGTTGTEVLARIAAEVTDWLAPGGLVACEMSEFHGPAVAGLFAHVDATIVRDLRGADRFVLGRRPVR